MNDEEIKKHFDLGLYGISPQEMASFCRLAEIIHSLNLDWWQTRVKREFARFGFKEIGSQRAHFDLGIIRIRGIKNQTQLVFSSNKSERVKGIAPRVNEPLTNELVEQFEKELKASKESWPDPLNLVTARGAYWPSNYVAQLGGPSPAAQTSS